MTPVSDQIRFIYFDLDDTLLDHKAAERASLLECHAQIDWLRAVEHHHLVDSYRTLNIRLWTEYGEGLIDRATLHRRRFEGTLEALGMGDQDAESFALAYMSVYRSHWNWVPGARATWDKVRGQWPVGIITNGFAETQKEKFRRFGLDLTADALVISEEVGVMKPHPEIFAYAARQASLRPDEILYVGDSPSSDIRGAAHAGFRTAWFVRDPYPDADGVPADLKFDDFNELDRWLGLD